MNEAGPDRDVRDPPRDDSPPTHGLATRTLRGAAWAYGAYAGARFIALATTAVLARLLDPSDFGLVALALVFITFADTIADLGLGDALVISSDEEESERANTAFVLLMALSVGLAVVMAALGPLAASIFDEPALVGILAALGLNFIFRGLGATHYALAQRRIEFRSRTVAEVADAAVRGITGIALAFAGFGAWSLVIGYLAGSVAMTVVLWAMVHWRPGFQLYRRHMRSMVRFGGTLTLVGLLAAGLQQVDYLFVGAALGDTALGLYTLAYRLPQVALLSLSVIAAQVLFPAFAAVDRDELGRVVTRSVGYVAMIGTPLALTLAILAEPLIVTVFGPKWHGAAPTMALLSISALATPASIVTGAACKALGRADILFKIGIPQFIVLCATLATFVHLGIAAAAGCHIANRLIFTSAAIVITARLIGTSPWRLLKAYAPSLTAGAGLVVVLLAVRLWVDSPPAAVLIGVVTGVPTYLALLWTIDRRNMRDLWRQARPPRSPVPAPTADAIL